MLFLFILHKKHNMPIWILYAIISMVFAGLTSVIAKFGLKELSSDLGLFVRTCVVFLYVSINAFIFQEGGFKQLGTVSPKSLMFLAISGITTSLSWIFYYRAMKLGNVSYVASIDKASIIITLLLSFWLLKEPITPKILIGGGLILAGMLVLVWK